jgi:hypothetical protein
MNEKTQPKTLPIEPEPSGDLGKCLHASFTAASHHSLSDSITRSLLHLSQEAKTASMRAKLRSS